MHAFVDSQSELKYTNACFRAIQLNSLFWRWSAFHVNAIYNSRILHPFSFCGYVCMCVCGKRFVCLWYSVQCYVQNVYEFHSMESLLFVQGKLNLEMVHMARLMLSHRFLIHLHIYTEWVCVFFWYRYWKCTQVSHICVTHLDVIESNN